MLARFLPALLLALALTAHPALAQEVSCVDGIAASGGRSYACSGVDLMAHIPLNQMGAMTGNDVWGWTDPVNGREYAIMGLNNGTFFVDVTVPDAPVLLGKLPSAGNGSSMWRDMKVYGDYAFIVADSNGPHGMQVFDLTRLRGLAANPTRVFTMDAHYTGIGSSHNLAINEATGYAYIVGGASGPNTCAGGLHMVNIQDPLNPTFVGCYAGSGYSHDAQCVIYDGPDTQHQGKEVCFGSNGVIGAQLDVLAIVDVTNKANPVLLAEGTYPNRGYLHQGWLTEDHRYFLANDEFDEQVFNQPTRTIVFDVTELANPQYLGSYFHNTPSITHNLFIRGRYAFASNYTTGLRVLDLNGLLAGGDLSGDVGVATVGFFDTYPQNDGRTFDGQWSNYPYFASGIVLASDINNGLFVLRPTGLATSGEPVTLTTPAAMETFPNPFAGQATVQLTLEAAEHVRVEVLDVLGRRVALLHDGVLPAGRAEPLTLDGHDLPPGVYVVRATGTSFALARPITRVR